MSAIFNFLCQLWVLPVMAASVDVSVSAGDKIVFKGFEAQVSFIQQSTAALRVNGIELSEIEGTYQVKKNEKTIEISFVEFKEPSALLAALAKPGNYSKKIEITGPSLPIEVQMRGGKVSLQNWSQNARVSLMQGKFASVEGNGNLSIYLPKGDVSVADHEGKVQVDTNNATLAVRNVQGDIDIAQFAGNLQIENVKGFTALNLQQAAAKLTQSSGTVQIENGKGQVTIQSFTGRVEGQSQEGNISVGVSLDSEIDLKSKTGRISVQLPSSSGALLNLRTSEGEISVPGEIKVSKLKSEKSVRGRLRGDAQRVTVFVRSEEGTISVK